ncbi:MAG: 1-deoxy-D-xylulose-5-phosphate synthase [Lachnospiraceae bacterium]|nr:1-deoxy-D-xylulose-5-phosphate synthase [Lachnospiraceae bacterium]
MYPILDKINNPNDIKKIDKQDYNRLAKEIRAFLARNVSKTGGHLASNLGVVELTMAIHLCLDFPEDKLIWDVGHQSYVHKILTGRKDRFETLRQYGGLSGFPRISESDTDAFDSGHASTSVSVGLGYAFAREMQNKHNKVFTVIGDGSMTGGLFYEAVNNAVSLKSGMIIVLNDNNMSISKSVGGMSHYLMRLRTDSRYRQLKENTKEFIKSIPEVGEKLVDKVKRSKSHIKHLFIPGMIFEDMGLTYMGPIDGHDINELVRTFNDALSLNKPVVVHVKTVKGKGYRFAEANPSMFHGVEPFNVNDGQVKKVKSPGVTSYNSVFGKKLVSLAENDDKICAVCAAMPQGTGLTEFADTYKDRFFDVGIAEEHAVTFAGALAAGGMKPVVALYSTFLQRAYDQLIHDICLSKHHVVFAIDRGGLVGSDGETHQGIFDISYLTSIPNLTVMAPKNDWELEAMLEYALNECDGPVAIRYPRGDAYTGLSEYCQDIDGLKAEVIHEGKHIAMLAYGSMVERAEKAYNTLISEGINVTLVNMRYAKPIDYAMVDKMCKEHEYVITLEENVMSGGLSEHIAAYISWKNLSCKCISVCLPDEYIEHGSCDILYKKYGIDAETITERVRGIINEGKA